MSVLTDELEALRTEITAALAALEPQIRGLEDLTHVSLSDQAKAEITQEKQNLQARKNLLTNVLSAIDALEAAMSALEADGYPEVPKTVVSPEVAMELKEQAADLAAAFAMFEPGAPATNIKVVLGTPVPK